MSDQPLVSIVTPAYNAVDTLQETIESVLGQTYANIEYIVMDGGSKDGTLDLLKSYEGRIIYISEPDKGQSDAINKGWKLCKGDIVAWLCADDLYYSYTVQKAVDAFNANPKIKWVYGIGQRIDKSGQPFPFRDPTLAWNYQKLLEYGNYITQPTVFMRRELLDELGYVRTDLNFIMDYELWLRIGKKYPAYLIPEKLAMVKTYPETKSSSGGLARLSEIEALLHKYEWDEIPEGLRHDWTRTYMNTGFRRLKQLKLQESMGYFSKGARYPHHIPRALMKNLLDSLPQPIQNQLRILLIRE